MVSKESTPVDLALVFTLQRRSYYPNALGGYDPKLNEPLGGHEEVGAKLGQVDITESTYRMYLGEN